MKRKWLAALLSLTMTASLLAGCGGDLQTRQIQKALQQRLALRKNWVVIQRVRLLQKEKPQRM